MNKEDWLRAKLLTAAPQENKRMRENCNMKSRRDQWDLIQASKVNGSKGGNLRRKTKGETK
jgi:hypothetical protein|tara:strand:- start:173 stop:355 length:183 start_codon:yes stop_codon:yes gene_type:complete